MPPSSKRTSNSARASLLPMADPWCCDERTLQEVRDKGHEESGRLRRTEAALLRVAHRAVALPIAEDRCQRADDPAVERVAEPSPRL